jgi:DNA helicase-2/ATP-dependent DNA helicase PcrA
MSKNNNPEFKKEENRLDYTIDYLKHVINSTDEYKKSFKDNIKDAFENLDYLDSSQSYINIIMNANFLQVAMKNYDSYRKALKKPYFARIDIQASESQEVEALYIGKTSLFREEDNQPLIIDWRSPLASVYYDGRLGEVTYETVDGEQTVDLQLKRQLTIDKGELLDYIDIDLTANDSFLQAALEANADDKLKDIASSIQAEQNKIIRANIKQPLIVQGVAGSGKTTIALHRIAYFIYTYEDTFDPENFMIIAPNKVFINYISDVLPELGVEDVKQTTFTEFMLEVLDLKLKLESPYKDMKIMVENKKVKDSDLLEWLLAYKGSLDFKNMLDAYIQDVESQFLPIESFALQEHVLVSSKSIQRMLQDDLKDLPIYKALAEIEKNLKYQLKNRKKVILDRTENEYDERIEYIRFKEKETEERRLKLVDLIDKRDNKLNSLKKDATTLVRKYMKSFPQKKLLDYFKELFTVENVIKYTQHPLTEKQINFLVDYMGQVFRTKTFDLEDLTTLVYLKYKLFGLDYKLNIKNVVIDEAQDYSVFQLYVLKDLLKTNMFTLLGDLSQGIYSYRAFDTWNEVIHQVFDEIKPNYMTLVQSYRTTVEIMEVANEIIKQFSQGLELAKPVIRHGNKPLYKVFEDKEAYVDAIYKSVKSKEADYSSIALICKTLNECQDIQKLLRKKGLDSIHILDEEQDTYGGGHLLVPSYLAKGLEFDIVLVITWTETYSTSPLDLKLLYVAMTRAMHRLEIYAFEQGIEPIENIDKNFLEIL